MNLCVLSNGDLQLGDWKYRVDLKSTLIIYLNTYRCNFDCSTCVGWHEKGNPDSLVAKHGSQKVSDAFQLLAEKLERRLCILFTGGEPTIQIDFIDFLEKLTMHSSVIIQTNLCTLNIRELAKRINPERVAQIEASFHFTVFDQQPQLEQKYLRNFRLLADSSFPIACKILAVPWELPPSHRFRERVTRIKEKLPGNGILYITHFIGSWKGKPYPDSYTKEQREFLAQVMTVRKSEQVDYMHGAQSFKDMPCDAGRGIATINRDGDFWRCLSDKTSLGNLLQEDIHLSKAPEPCRSKICSCPTHALWFGFQPWKYFGEDSPRSYNRFVANKINLGESIR